MEITGIGRGVKTVWEQALEGSPLSRVHQPHQLAEENSSGHGLVYLGAEGRFVTSWNHRMLRQMGPPRSSDSPPPF